MNKEPLEQSRGFFMSTLTRLEAGTRSVPVHSPRQKSAEQLGKIIDGHIQRAIKRMDESGRSVDLILADLLIAADKLADTEVKARIIYGFLSAAAKYSVQQIEQKTTVDVRVSAEPMSVEDWQQQAQKLTSA